MWLKVGLLNNAFGEMLSSGLDGALVVVLDFTALLVIFLAGFFLPAKKKCKSHTPNINKVKVGPTLGPN